MTDEYVETTYESMTIDTLKKAGEKMMKIIYKDEDFYFIASIKEDSNQLIIHNNGAVDHTKRKPPVAQRSSWSEDIEANCIFFDDKTIHSNELNTGWGAGNIKRFYLEDYSAITKKIQELLSIESRDVFYWGSSAGGYMSIILSSMHKETTAISNNPQTLLPNHYKGKIDKLLNTAFDGMSRGDAFKKYPERFSVVEAMKEYGYIPKIYYLQNNQFHFDMVQHFRPFIEALKESGISEEKNYYIFYNDYERGHSPLSKEDTLHYLHNIIGVQ